MQVICYPPMAGSKKAKSKHYKLENINGKISKNLSCPS